MIRSAIAIITLGLVLLLASCSDRAWPQRAADLRAAALAAGQAQDQTTCDLILKAMAADILALTATMPDLPASTWTPTEIAADPEHYAEAAAERAPAYDPPAPPASAPPDRLRALGDSVLTWGGIVAAVGWALWILAGLASWAPWLRLGWVGALVSSPAISPLVRAAAALGSSSVVVGAALSWLAAWLWLVVLACVVAAGVAAWFYRRAICRAWARVRGRAA